MESVAPAIFCGGAEAAAGGERLVAEERDVLKRSVVLWVKEATK